MSQKGFIKIVIITAILIFSGVVVYLALLQKDGGLKTGFKTILYPQTVPQNQEVSWKTYRNEKYGFKFQYPSNWFIQQEGDELLTREGRIILYFNDQQQVDFENHKISLDLQHVDNSFFVEHVRANKPVSVAEGTDVSNSIILIDGREVVLEKITYSEPSDSLLSRKTTKYEVVIPLGENTFFIKSQAAYKSTLDQILSSFRFTR